MKHIFLIFNDFSVSGRKGTKFLRDAARLPAFFGFCCLLKGELWRRGRPYAAGLPSGVGNFTAKKILRRSFSASCDKFGRLCAGLSQNRACVATTWNEKKDYSWSLLIKAISLHQKRKMTK
ncbi:MAG: hypothetical protein IKQ58_00240 [Prevotella sp.]|nr:hypothetical protein [Prevotella sp.]